MGGAANRMGRFGWGLGFATVALLVGAAYLPSLQGGFLMSDGWAVAGNPRLSSLHGLRSLWSPVASDVYPPIDQYQPLHYTLLWLERHLWGLWPPGYRAMSLALHALDAVLVWALLVRIGGRGAWLAAALFALHPVHVESVAWIYEQKNPSSGAFFFLALLAYLKFEEGARPRRWYAAALLLFAAALLTKSSTVMLPAILLLLAWFRRDPWRSLAPLLPFFGLAALAAALTIWHEGAVTGATGEPYAAGLLERVARAGWVLGFHAGKLLFPANLAFFYPLWSVDPGDWRSYLPDLAILALLAALWLRRDTWGRPALLGVGYYLVVLFPVAGFFDIYYHQFSLAADHFQYLASVGPIALGVHAAFTGLERAERSLRGARRAAGAAAALLVAGLWLLTWQRAHVFVNDGQLARDAAEKYPTSWLAFQKSGEFLLRGATADPSGAGPRIEQAIDDLERAVRLRPDHPQVHDSLGVAYLFGDRLEDARRHIGIAIEGDPANPNFHRNLGAVLEAQGEIEGALAAYRAMLDAAPGSLSGRLLLGEVLVREQRFNEAVGILDVLVEQASAPRPGLLRQARQLRVQAAAGAEAVLAPPPDFTRERPAWNVLLLTVDTLRPDYLGWNGYDLPTSPVLDALLREAISFEHAVTPVPRTTPALASLLTGAYPHATGVRSLADPLPGHMVTLAEAFARNGYQTLAVVTNLLLAPVRGLGAGFDVYDFAHDVRDARRTTDAALRHLEAADPEQPLFAWVHYIDPHVPYDPDDEIAERFDPGYEGRFRAGFGRQPREEGFDDLFREFPEGLKKAEVTHRNRLTDEENAHIRRLYAGEIRLLDEQIDRLLRAFRSRFPHSVIVFTADHGESLGEHDFYFDHGDYVYDASSRVPLAFALPPGHPWHRAGRRSGWVSLVDVAPTLFEVVGLEPPPEMAVLFEGRSLAPALRGEALPPRPAFIESGTSFFPELVRRRQRNDVRGRFRAVVLEDWKLIWTPFLPAHQAWELYHLASDPGETRNLYRPDHPQVARLKRRLREWLARASPGAIPERPLTAADREALRKLGYLE